MQIIVHPGTKLASWALKGPVAWGPPLPCALHLWGILLHWCDCWRGWMLPCGEEHLMS